MDVKTLPRFHPALPTASSRAAAQAEPLAGLARVARWLAFALLLLYVAQYVTFAVQLALYPLGIDQGEGYDAWSGWLVRLGQLPYSTSASLPYYSSNYPPLWSALVAIPMMWSGPTLAPARVISVVCTVISTMLIAWAAVRLTRREHPAVAIMAGAIAAVLFLASPYVFHTTPLARVNSMALMFSLLAVTAAEQPTPRRLALASLALVAAVFTKPTALDAVLAIALFVLAVRPRGLPTLAALFVGPAVVLLLMLQVLTGGTYLLNVATANANPFDFGQLGTYLLNFLVTHGLFVALAVLPVARGIQQRAWSPWTLFFLVAAVMTLTVGKWGAGESYFLPLIALTSVLAGGEIARLLFPPRRLPLAARFRPPAGTEAAALLSVALLLQAVIMSHGPVADLVGLAPDRGPQARTLGRIPAAREQEAASEIVRRIREVPGPVLSEEPSFMLAAGRPVIGNATQLRNLHQSRSWSPDALVADVRARRFDLVILSAELFPPPVLDAIGRSYYLDYSVLIGGTTYYVFLPGGDEPA
jgi:hypothetical protein